MKRILVADDEAALRLMIGKTLRGVGAEVVQACDGEEALKLAKSEMPDLLLLDWMMPKRTGIEVAGALRDHEPTSRIPVIMLTARGQARDQEAARIAGVDSYLAKPFSPRELLALVEQVLEGPKK